MSDDEILEEARAAFQLAADAEAENRREALDDLRFARLGEQWPEKVRRERDLEGRPCLTINRLPAFIRQVVNDARQEELAATQHREIDNRPPPEVVATLRTTAARMEQVRRLLGDRVISVSSGYRCPELNRAVGGARTSAHLTGHAVDYNCYGFGAPIEVCRAIADSTLSFDQLIEEGSWIHLSFDPRLRRQVLTKRPGGGYELGLRS